MNTYPSEEGRRARIRGLSDDNRARHAALEAQAKRLLSWVEVELGAPDGSLQSNYFELSEAKTLLFRLRQQVEKSRKVR
jgi:hypothetical protein